MRHPRAIIADLDLALPIAGSPADTPRPPLPAAVPAADTARHPGGDANDHRPQASYIKPPWPAA